MAGSIEGEDVPGGNTDRAKEVNDGRGRWREIRGAPP